MRQYVLLITLAETVPNATLHCWDGQQAHLIIQVLQPVPSATKTASQPIIILVIACPAITLTPGGRLVFSTTALVVTARVAIYVRGTI